MRWRRAFLLLFMCMFEVTGLVGCRQTKQRWAHMKCAVMRCVNMDKNVPHAQNPNLCVFSRSTKVKNVTTPPLHHWAVSMLQNNTWHLYNLSQQLVDLWRRICCCSDISKSVSFPVNAAADVIGSFHECWKWCFQWRVGSTITYVAPWISLDGTTNQILCLVEISLTHMKNIELSRWLVALERQERTTFKLLNYAIDLYQCILSFHVSGCG